MIKEFVKYKLKATNLHGIHSPFVYQLYENVIANQFNQPDLLIEKRRKELKKSTNEIEVTDFGAGTKGKNVKKRKVSSITSYAAMPVKYALLLQRLVTHFAPQSIIELGTSVGLTTAYIAKAAKGDTVHTFEGCPNISAVAEKTLEKCNVENVKAHLGEFGTTVPFYLNCIDKIDLALVDGNHKKEPTLQYFNWLVEKAHPGTVLVFDDINWSAEMREAWNEIKKDTRVVVTLDFFKLGVVFFKTGQAKEDFLLRF